MRSPPARRSLMSSIIVDWFLAPRRWRFNLKSNFYELHRPWSPRGSSPHKENPHGRAGNRTRDLVISSQKLWPLDHEAGHQSNRRLCLRDGLDLLEKGIIYFSLLVIEPRFLTFPARNLLTLPSQIPQLIDLLGPSGCRNVHGLPVHKPYCSAVLFVFCRTSLQQYKCR